MTRSKIVSLDALKNIVAEARSCGRRVVFANGCFDLLHVGHIRYLRDAASRGDLLLVGVNGDASVQHIKEVGRPLQDQAERAEIIAALEMVDWVIVFEEDTVDPLLHSLQPDVHAKGTDYTVDTVPERDTVRAYGGVVTIAGDSKSHSTRDLIRTILSRTG